MTHLQWIWLVHALVLGQGLNSAIYRAIGKAGVYYGYRLGEPVPWVTGFPFSVVPHPQYFGVCVCVIGVNIFVATEAHIAAGWFNLTIVQARVCLSSTRSLIRTALHARGLSRMRLHVRLAGPLLRLHGPRGGLPLSAATVSAFAALVARLLSDAAPTRG